jgi:NAD(P)-dependent dehydrogenase (short-subunit alcohol dehydrogenase family)
MDKKPESLPKQSQPKQPGREHMMNPLPEVIRDDYKGSNKLMDQVALITGGDSGIGRSVAVHFAREGANVAIVYLEEDDDAKETKEMVAREGRDCLLLKGDVSDEKFCRRAVVKTVEKFNRLDILVNNVAIQFPSSNVEDVTPEQFRKTFEVNIFHYFYFSQEAVKYMKNRGAIINTTSVNAFTGNDHLLDYSSTKGAIMSFTFSLAKQLAEKGIRVNAVAPGPIWTPLIPATMDVESFGKKSLLGRPGQPSEIGPAYVFLASKDSSYMIGQTMHINGGQFVGT